MSTQPPKSSKNRFLNGWWLFGLIASVTSLVMLVAMTRTELSSGPAVSSMIQLSVRWSVPWLFLAFAASSVQILRPGAASLWLARNRKYIGLCFAAAMAWQGFFILWMVIGHTDYYVNEVYVLRDAIEGTIGYTFLAAMTVTSFMPARRNMSPRSWKLLHKTGIYYLWMYAFSVYWWELFYYKTPDAIDYVYYVVGFLAWGLRAAAWSKRARKRRARDATEQQGSGIASLGGYIAIAAGLVGAVTGALWYPTAERLLTGYALTSIPETYVPYWPFEPWLPLLLIAFGAWLVAVRGSTPGASPPNQ